MPDFEGLWPTEGVLRFRLVIPTATPSNNTIKNMHHQAYKQLRRTWRMEVLVALGRNRPKEPIKHAFLIIRRECAGEGLDWDNAYGGLKPLLDCLVSPSTANPDGLGVIFDDSPKYMPYPPYITQGSAPLKKSQTTVEIFDCSPRPTLSPN